MASPPLEWSSRCQRWLEEIDVQHLGEQELAELASIKSFTAGAECSRQQSVTLSVGTAVTQITNDWNAKMQDLSTPLCMGLMVTIPQWSYVQDVKQRKFAIFHLACRRGNVAWEVRKRYSDFVLLHHQLQHQYRLALFIKMREKSRPEARHAPFTSVDTAQGRFSVEPLPSLPGRRLWPPTNHDVDAVIRRCTLLQGYLHQLMQLPRPTQPFSPLNRFFCESTSSYVRVLSTSHIVSHMDGDHPKITPNIALTAPEPLEAGSDLMRRLAREPSKALIRIEYPDWVQHEEFWTQQYQTDFEKMQLVIDISRKNVSFGSGGPFGAAIFNRTTNRLVSVGMSLVEHGNNCCLHAEMVAVQMATTLLRSHTLDRDPSMEHELFSSSEPCAMCIGATLWCGVQKLVCAATDVDVRSLLHDTGPVFEESFRYLQSKGIEIKRKFLRSEAKQVLCEYSAVRTSVMGRQV